MDIDEMYMKRCIALALLGRGSTSPNPMVGSVIVCEGKIIGEGYHKQCGEAHAEVNAIGSVKDLSLLAKSTLYVNLEPCAHFGKTPPCSDLIVAHKIPRVVIGCVDSYSEVAGKGIAKMKKAGIDVTVGVLEEESVRLNRRFFTFHMHKRPYIILKWAQTLDGYIDLIGSRKEQQRGVWITNHLCKKIVHKWRTEEDAILVGTNTALVDNPQLNVREWKGKNPIRLVFDRSKRLPANLNLFDGSQPTIVFTEKKKSSKENLTFIQMTFGENPIKTVLDKLFEMNIQSVIVEGGELLLSDFIDNGYWDEARVFVGNRFFGEGVHAPKFDFQPFTTRMIDDSQLLLFKKNGN